MGILLEGMRVSRSALMYTTKIITIWALSTDERGDKMGERNYVEVALNDLQNL